MIRQILIKVCLAVIIVAAIVTVNRICGQSETGSTDEHATITNSLIIEQTAWLADEKQIQSGKDVNGLSCVLRIRNTPWNSDERPPVCGISINNISTNILTCWIGFYGDTYSKIELLNSKGEPVKKTTIGKQIGTRADNVQIKEMVKNRLAEWSLGKARTDGFIPIRPGQNCGIAFSIPDLFDLKQSGEYSLKVQTCLIQRVGWKGVEPALRITWLPEITDKIQLRSEDISPENLPPNGQVNSLTK